MRPLSAVVLAVVRADGMVLSVSRRHKPQLAGLPGGKVDPGETTLQAVVRETAEEIGLCLDPVQLEPVYSAMCHGQGPRDSYWVTTYLYPAELVAAGELRAEDGLTLSWQSEQVLSDAQHSPFAAYNAGLFQALREYNAAAELDV